MPKGEKYMDIRSQRTRQSICDCFIHLLNEKTVAKITVTEICEMAHINRATFYKHFLDVPDLLENLTQQVLAELQQFLEQHLQRQFEEMILDTLCYMKQNGQRYLALGSEKADPNLAAKTFAMCYQSVFPVLEKQLPRQNPEQKKLLYYYLSQGCGGVLSHWLSSGMKQEPQEIAHFIMRASIHTVRGFQEE